MKSSTLVILVAASLSAATAVVVLAFTPPTDPCDAALNKPVEFPNLVDFNVAWTKDLTPDNARQHGWALLQGATGPAAAGCPASRVPLWLSWITKRELFFPANGKKGPRKIQGLASNTLGERDQIDKLKARPLNERLSPEDPFLIPDDNGGFTRVVFSSVHYNPAAQNVLARTPDAMIQAYQQQTKFQEPTPGTAIVIKPIWWPVDLTTIATCLPVWSPTVPTGVWSARADGWRERVWVSDQAAPGQTKKCFGPDGKPMDARVVGLSEFFSMEIDPGNQKALQLLIRPGLANIAKPGNKALLVGFHVISKELPTWSWNTFWWEPAGYRNQGNTDRPKLDAPWTSYVMNSSLSAAGMPTPDGAGVCQPVNAIYNPYQEAALENSMPESQPVCGKPGVTLGGLASNCLSCHSRASYKPPSGRIPVTIQPPQLDDFTGKTRTGFLWSLPFYLDQ
jgi:hypothetical protein